MTTSDIFDELCYGLDINNTLQYLLTHCNVKINTTYNAESYQCTKPILDITLFLHGIVNVVVDLYIKYFTSKLSYCSKYLRYLTHGFNPIIYSNESNIVREVLHDIDDDKIIIKCTMSAIKNTLPCSGKTYYSVILRYFTSKYIISVLYENIIGPIDFHIININKFRMCSYIIKTNEFNNVEQCFNEYNLTYYINRDLESLLEKDGLVDYQIITTKKCTSYSPYNKNWLKNIIVNDVGKVYLDKLIKERNDDIKFQISKYKRYIYTYLHCKHKISYDVLTYIYSFLIKQPT